MEQGQVDEARGALDDLLALGPGNLEALKVKAAIFGSEGRFRDEEQIWHQILEANPEDEDAVEYVQQRQIDFYFTDDLPGGSRRFLAYPRALVKISLLGLIGCVSFLLLTKVAEQEKWSFGPELIFASFFFFVICPWIGILASWSTSLKNIVTGLDGLIIATRFKSYAYKWTELKSICLVYANNPLDPDLRLMFTPSDGSRPILVDLNEGSSSIKARTYLVNELSHYFPEITYSHEDQVLATELRPRHY